VFDVDCAGACGAPLTMFAALDPLPAAPPAQLDEVHVGTLSTTRRATAFYAETVGASRREALIHERNGTVSVAAIQGQPVVRTGAVYTFSQFTFPGQWLGGYGRPALDRREVAFLADVADVSGLEYPGIFHWENGTVTMLALEGDPAPAPALGTFFRFTVPSLRSGRVVFGAQTTGGSECVFKVDAPSGTIGVDACAGDPIAPPVGGTILDFTGPPDLASATRVGIGVRVTGGAASKCIVQSRGVGMIRAIVCDGTPAPVGMTAFDFATGSNLLELEGRRIAYYTTSISTPAVVLQEGIQLRRIQGGSGPPTKVYADGDEITPGVHFTDFGLGAFTLTRDSVAFDANLTAGGPPHVIYLMR
jgi:hypothetical protein